MIDTAKKINVPQYGRNILSEHVYDNEKRSGVPVTYTQIVESVVTNSVNEIGGVFLDVGGGTGELEKRVVGDIGVKSVTVDYSPVGLIGKDVNGVVAEASALPIEDKVVGVLHSKDMIEHLDSSQFDLFIQEGKRVLVDGGKIIITEKYYFPGFPIYQKPSVPVKSGDKLYDRWILDGEKYADTVERMIKIYGKDVAVGAPVYPRSHGQIIEKMKSNGFVCEGVKKWRPKRDEPDWFGGSTRRNIMVFKLDKRVY